MISCVSIAPRPFPSRCALIIGAHPEIDAVVSDNLLAGEWSIFRVPDNEAALILASENAFDLILTSQASSGHDDVRFLRAVRHFQTLVRVIILARSGNPFDLIDGIREHVFSYLSGAFSAVTLAEMIRLAAQNPCAGDGIELLEGAPDRLRAKIRCDLDSADRMLQFLKEMMAGVPAEESNALAIAAREILFNAIEYGGNLDPHKSVEVFYFRSNEVVCCRITDPGDGFEIENIPHAAISNPKDDPARHITYRLERGMRPGGFGVLVAKRAVDALIFNDKGNEALLVKYIRPTVLDSGNFVDHLIQSNLDGSLSAA